MAFCQRDRATRMARAARLPSQGRYEANIDSLAHDTRIPKRLYAELLALRGDSEG